MGKVTTARARASARGLVHACTWARASGRVHACTCVLSHQSLDGTTIALRSPLGGTREVARATGCRSRPWGDIGLGVRKAIRYYS